MRLVLASASPARQRLLRDAGLGFDVLPSDVDESAVTSPDPGELVRELAVAKARAVAAMLAGAADPRSTRVLVLGCDSLLDVDGRAYGKPPSRDAAREVWTLLAGRSGVLRTGHCLVELHHGAVTRETAHVASTTVHFGDPDPAEVDAYLASEEPLRVAGGFTLDGLSGWFVEGIDGDHGNVLGLSLPLVRRMLREHGVRVTDLWCGD